MGISLFFYYLCKLIHASAAKIKYAHCYKTASYSTVTMRTRLFIALIVLLPSLCLAQSDDFGTKLSAEVRKVFNKKTNIDFSAEMRTRDRMKATDRWAGHLEGHYKVWPWMKASVGYSLLCDHEKHVSRYDEDDRDVIKGLVEVGDPKNKRVYWIVRHRVTSSLTFSHKWDRWKFSLRERWQYTYRPEKVVAGRYNYYYQKSDAAERLVRGKGKNVLRSRLMIEYDIAHSPVTPLMSLETFHAWRLEQVRYILGAKWKIDKQNALELSYRYQHVDQDDDYEPHRHIVGLNYQYQF